MALRAEEIVSRLRARDDEAFQALANEYSGLIRHWARMWLGDAGEAEDIVQDVLFAAWKSAPSLRAGTALTGWLKTVSDNACRKRVRTWARRPAVPSGLAPHARTAAQPADVASRVTVDAALRQLPDREAQVLRLLYTRDLPLEEAAEQMQVSPEAMKSLAARARRRFRDRFGEWFKGGDSKSATGETP